MTFKRYLSPEMTTALDREYSKENSWWCTLTDHEDTLIAIRDGYLNVYRNGCNLAKVEFRNGSLVASIHYKFLMKKNINSPYIACSEGRPQITNTSDLFINSLCEIGDIKYWTDKLGGDEKTGVHRIICSNPNIIDTEIAISDESDDDDIKNSRIDFCAIQEENGRLFLRFFEVKHYSNNALRAKGDTPPKVLSQLMEYQTKLGSQSDTILKAYIDAIRITAQIEGNNILGKSVASSELEKLEVDPQPRLVVFGYDDDHKNGRFWSHMEKLREHLGEERLLLRGSANGFDVGISKTRSGQSLMSKVRV